MEDASKGALDARTSVLSRIRGARSFWILTHQLPDGDAVGSQMALHLGLREIGKASVPLGNAPLPDKFQFVDSSLELQISPQTLSNAPDLILIVDTHEFDMLGPLKDVARKYESRCIFIDHHVPQTRASTHLLDESRSATAEMIFELLKDLGAPLTFPVAQAIYVGLVSDTGHFRFRRTSPRVHRIAAELLESGVLPEVVHDQLFSRETPERMRFLAHVLGTVRLDLDGKLAWISVLREERLRFGASVEDTESFIEQLTLLKGVRIVALFREEDDGRVKVSLRGLARTSVIEIAEAVGGGGHRYAAGARVSEAIGVTSQRVLDLCRKAIDRQK